MILLNRVEVLFSKAKIDCATNTIYIFIDMSL